MDPCVHKDMCGGCIYQGIPYEEQVSLKEKEVLALLKKEELEAEEYLGFEGSPQIYGYRNKMEYTFGDMVKDGEMTLGLHVRKRFMSVVTTDQCQIVDPDFNLILISVLDFVKGKGYKKYNKKSHEGLLRHLIIRKGERTGELLINIVTTGNKDPGRTVRRNSESAGGKEAKIFDDQAFVDLLLALHGQLKNKIIGIIHTYNNSLSDAVIAEEVDLLYGRDYYRESIMGLDFKVGAFSFFQTNVEAAERLYKDGIGMLPDIKNKVIFDLYCGTGTISQSLAKEAKSVTGLEIVKEAVDLARKTAEINKLTNCHFIEGDVLKTLDQIEEVPDIIVLDPPRAGIHPKALNKLLDYKVKYILYISCNPKTMTSDMKIMADRGYRLEKFKGYDNFPFTKHIEACGLLRLQS